VPRPCWLGPCWLRLAATRQAGLKTGRRP